MCGPASAEATLHANYIFNHIIRLNFSEKTHKSGKEVGVAKGSSHLWHRRPESSSCKVLCEHCRLQGED